MLSKLPLSKNEAAKDHTKAQNEAKMAAKIEAIQVINARRKRRNKARKRANDFSCATSNLGPKLDVALGADLLQGVEYYKELNLLRAGLSRPDLYGMESCEIEAMEFLENGTSSLLGISGMSGVGKTTLLRLLRTYYSQHRPFRFVFWANAGTGFEASILRRILAMSIGIGVDLMPVVPGVKFISSNLEGETFLLLLDDVQRSFDLAAAGLPMPLGPRQKVVFTTRDESVCAKMGCAGNIIRMQRLNAKLSWDLFRYNVGDGIIETNPEIGVLAKQICEDCRGFPSALSTVGRSMSIKRDVKEWRYARDSFKIQNSLSNETEEVDHEGCPCVSFFEDEF